MSGEYEKPITIEKGINQIVERRYLLPAIQRKFTWSSSQICVLFDSIMRGYPINTFMSWEIKKDSEVRNDFRFYQFLEQYCECFGENNPDFDLKGRDEFFAIIDGQQRLTSLYIGLKGTYAYKLPRKWWPNTKDDTILPPRKLYLNLAAPLDAESNEEMMEYEFKFLTDAEFSENRGKFWFQVGKILDFRTVNTNDEVLYVVKDFLEEQGQKNNEYAQRALNRLYFAIRLDKIIHFYNETDQSIDYVLDIFIRTNHGGTPLAFSDLLMSIAIANWRERDARQQIDDLVDQVRFSSDMEFSIDRDFVLKTALMLSGGDVRFKVKNFTEEQVRKIEQEWDDIKACILAVFRLIRFSGLNDKSLRAKNAAIPIAYYLFHKCRDKANRKLGLFTEINNPAKHDKERKQIQQWLHMSLLKGLFSGQGDTVLTNLRRIIKDSLANQSTFPLNKIIENYRGTNKDLTFDNDFIDRLLKTQKGESSCFSILALLLPDLDYTQALEIDHLHPQSAFSEEKLDSMAFFDNSDSRSFFENPENWNGIANLHLLNSSLNKSKKDMPLAEWLAKQNGIKAEDLLIPTGTPLAFDAFEEFIKARSSFLRKKLHSLVGGGHE